MAPPAELKELNTPEQDMEAFRQLCLSDRSDQLQFFEERFVKKLGKEGIREAEKVAAEYSKKVGTKKEFSVVSTEFTDFMSTQQIEFASMKQRKEAFKDLDIDGNAHVSLIEVLVFINKQMVLGCSEERWGVAPPTEGEPYTKAVLRELFLPAQGFEKSFDTALVTFVRNTEEATKKKEELEKSKEGMNPVKQRNTDQAIQKLEKTLEDNKKNFDRDLPKVARIAQKAKKEVEKIKEEIKSDDDAADKNARGAVKKGAFKGK